MSWEQKWRHQKTKIPKAENGLKQKPKCFRFTLTNPQSKATLKHPPKRVKLLLKFESFLKHEEENY